MVSIDGSDQQLKTETNKSLVAELDDQYWRQLKTPEEEESDEDIGSDTESHRKRGTTGHQFGREDDNENIVVEEDIVTEGPVVAVVE